MVNYIETYILTCEGKIKADQSNILMCVNGLQKKREEFVPIINWCKKENLNIQKEFPEINKDWNRINLAIEKGLQGSENQLVLAL